MRIAVALCEEDVAPRFCSADRILVAEIEDGSVIHRQIVSVGRFDFSYRLSHLAKLGVDRLLCGGFNRRFLPMAEALGIQVTWGLWGNAESALDLVASGSTPPAIGRRGRGRGRGRGGGRSRQQWGGRAKPGRT